VNVSPTKSEVHFLDQEDIIEIICNAMQAKLSSANQSRTFTVQTLLPGAQYLNPAESSSSVSGKTTGTSRPISTAATKLPPQKLVRTDAKAQTLDSMMQFTTTPKASDLGRKSAKRKASEVIEVDSDGEQVVTPLESSDDDDHGDEESGTSRSKYRDNAQPAAVHGPSQAVHVRRTKIPLVDCDLTSVQELRAELTANTSEGIETHHMYMCISELISRAIALITAIEAVMKSHTFVGVVDLYTGRSALQHGTKLYLVDHNVLAEELFYQLILRQFGEIGKLKLKPPPSLKELLEMAIEDDENAPTDPVIRTKIVNVRVSQSRPFALHNILTRLISSGCMQKAD
jgi:DNA mismatch repair protein MLH1